MKIDNHGCLIISDPANKNQAANPVKVQDLSLRDGHMSLFAVQERTKNVLKHISMLDTLGFHSIQVLTGYSPLMIQQHLNSEPWKKIQSMKKYAQKTHLSMTVSNQLHEDTDEDICLSLIENAVESGIDIVRVFNPYNEDDRIKDAAAIIKKHKKHFQGTVCYNQVDPTKGRDTKHTDFYLSKFNTLLELGADSLCILDSAGLMSPYEAYNLITALKDQTDKPILLHTNFSTGMADLTVLKAIEAGVDIIDTCLAPFAFRNSLPALEPLVFALNGTTRDTDFDPDALLAVSREMESYASAYKHMMDATRTSTFNIDRLSALRDSRIKEHHELTAAAIAQKGVEKDLMPEIPMNAESFNIFVDGEYFDVKISKGGGPRKSRIRKKDNTEAIIRERTLASPLPGLIVEIKKKVGDHVKIGDTVTILEAMKMLNRLEAKNTGIIKEIRVREGEMVEKGDVICVIE